MHEGDSTATTVIPELAYPSGVEAGPDGYLYFANYGVTIPWNGTQRRCGLQNQTVMNNKLPPAKLASGSLFVMGASREATNPRMSLELTRLAPLDAPHKSIYTPPTMSAHLYSPFSPDEHGLRGVSLDLYLRQIFASLSPETVRELSIRMCMTKHSGVNSFTIAMGKIEVINVLLRPVAVFSEQLNYFHYVSQTLLGALKRMPELYLKDFQVRQVVPLEESEAKWLWDTWGASHNQFHTVFGRLDAIADLTGAFAKDSLSFIEPNLVGSGWDSSRPRRRRHYS